VTVDQLSLDGGDTAWVLVSAALVFLMTPGVGFFYGGMVRAHNVLGTITQSFAAAAVVTVVWVAFGYSLAFDDGGPLIGGFGLAGLGDPGQPVPGFPDLRIPPYAFALFQLMFAIITPALIAGAAAERWRFGSFLFFCLAWSLLVYAPVAHWVFSPFGWSAQMGALDFAGGTVVHANAGAAALVCAMRLGRRTGWPAENHRPHSLPLVLLGTVMLWLGWFGFNGGSALAADGIAATAFVNTQAAAAAGLLAWAAVERLRFGKATTLGAASGALAGLVAITPAAGYVTPLGALAIGVLAGAICQLAVGLKSLFRLDDSADVVAIHLGGGVLGSLCVGLFASEAVNSHAADGLFHGGGYGLLATQTVTATAVTAYSMVMTLIVLAVADRLVGNRLSQRQELAGLDLSQHGETGWSLGVGTDRGAAMDWPADGYGPADRTASGNRHRQVGH